MFEHPVPKADVDKTFITRLRPEFPGILNWMIEGLADWLDSGMREPDRVRAAMDDYRKGSSPFGEWFVERVEPADGVKTLASAFYADWKDWAEAQGIEKPMSQRAFGDAMADRQIIRAGKDASGKAWRIGARLRPKWAPAGGDVGAASAGFEADPGFAPRDPARTDSGRTVRTVRPGSPGRGGGRTDNGISGGAGSVRRARGWIA
jgi:putative DNA primase/helicase